ncbi:hypothetical protein [Desulfospira joergensenii]|uniref:hypothetical protein n=1 Tax=Desulfospira joergensenii TaxID=53329 RepID=UPI00042978A2|nr:hypothetical protein [Desulfospira joergensenii]
MEFPKIGETVDISQALELCRHFKLDYLVDRIESNRDAYQPWVFDGCSCIQEEFLGLLAGCDPDALKYKCCLPHDLGYAYGEPGNRMERKRVDLKFQSNLVNKAGMKEWMAAAMYEGVRVGGAEIFGRSFSWAFARKNR